MKDMISTDTLRDSYLGIDIECVFPTFNNRQMRLRHKGKNFKVEALIEFILCLAKAYFLLQSEIA